MTQSASSASARMLAIGSAPRMSRSKNSPPGGPNPRPACETARNPARRSAPNPSASWSKTGGISRSCSMQGAIEMPSDCAHSSVVGPLQFLHALLPGQPSPSHRWHPGCRRCLLKGCERWFVPRPPRPEPGSPFRSPPVGFRRPCFPAQRPPGYRRSWRSFSGGFGERLRDGGRPLLLAGPKRFPVERAAFRSARRAAPRNPLVRYSPDRTR